MNSTAEMIDLCTTCADTGHWQGEPEPCPECGAFVTRQKPEAKSLRYIEKHTGLNRHERRAQAKRIKKHQ